MLLVCDKGYFKGRRIMCKVSGIGCAHVRYCGMTMRWSQTDSAKDCIGRFENGTNNNETDTGYSGDVSDKG